MADLTVPSGGNPDLFKGQDASAMLKGVDEGPAPAVSAPTANLLQGIQDGPAPETQPDLFKGVNTTGLLQGVSPDPGQAQQDAYNQVRAIHPEEAGKVYRAAQNAGVPPQLVDLHPELKASADTPPADYGKMVDKQPVTAQFLADPANQALAKDDVPVLTKLEDAFNAVGSKPGIWDSVAGPWDSVSTPTPPWHALINSLLPEDATPDQKTNAALGLAAILSRAASDTGDDLKDMAKQGYAHLLAAANSATHDFGNVAALLAGLHDTLEGGDSYYGDPNHPLHQLASYLKRAEGIGQQQIQDIGPAQTIPGALVGAGTELAASIPEYAVSVGTGGALSQFLRLTGHGLLAGSDQGLEGSLARTRDEVAFMGAMHAFPYVVHGVEASVDGLAQAYRSNTGVGLELKGWYGKLTDQGYSPELAGRTITEGLQSTLDDLQASGMSREAAIKSLRTDTGPFTDKMVDLTARQTEGVKPAGLIADGQEPAPAPAGAAPANPQGTEPAPTPAAIPPATPEVRAAVDQVVSQAPDLGGLMRGLGQVAQDNGYDSISDLQRAVSGERPDAGHPEAQQFLARIEPLVEQSKLANRAPAVFDKQMQALVDQTGAPEHMFIPSEALTTLYQTHPDPDAIGSALEAAGVDEGSIAQSRTMGTPLAIQTSQVPKLFGTDVWESLKASASFSPTIGPTSALEAPQPAPTPTVAVSRPEGAPTLADRITEVAQQMVAAGRPKAQANKNAATMGLLAKNWARQTGADAADWPRWKQLLFVHDFAPTPPPQKNGPLSVATERGTQVGARWEVVDASQLVTSHDDDLRLNPAFPEGLQPRDRTRGAYQMQVAKIEQNLNPERLAENPMASDGAPVVGPDNVVESGNGRTIAVRRAYAKGSEKAAAYKDWLLANGARFGLDPQAITALPAPVLIRRRMGTVNRESFVREANESSVTSMSATEQASSDARALVGTELLDLFRPSESGLIDTAPNRQFVEGFLGLVSPNEIGLLRDNRSGHLSQTGETRIRNALFAAAYGDSLSLEKLAESPDNRAKNVTTALMMVAPEVARFKQAIKAGRAYDLDLSDHLVAAADKLQDLRRQGVKLRDHLAQADMFKDQEPLTAQILRLYDKAGFRKIKAVLDEYLRLVDSLGNPRQDGLLGDMPVPSREELLALAEKQVAAGKDAASAGTLFQSADQAAKGSVDFGPDDLRTVVRLFQGADASTILHEIGHIARRELEALAQRPDARDQVKSDWLDAQAYVGAEEGKEWTTDQEETFARAWERYWLEGQSPTPELRPLFERFRKWLSDIYNTVKALGVKMTPDIRGVFDRIVASEDEIAQARAQTMIKPAFSEPPAAISPEQWVKYNDDVRQAYYAAADNVLKRRLGDWRKAKAGWEVDARQAYTQESAVRELREVQELGLNRADVAQSYSPETVAALDKQHPALLREEAPTVDDWGKGDDLPERLLATPTEAQYVGDYIENQSVQWDKGLTPYELAITDEYTALMKTEAEMMVAGQTIQADIPTIKAQIRKATGWVPKNPGDRVVQPTVAQLQDRMVPESQALKAGLQKAARAATKAWSQGNSAGAATEKLKQLNLALKLQAVAQTKETLADIKNDFARMLKNRPNLKTGIQYDFDAQIRNLLADYGIGGKVTSAPGLTGVTSTSFNVPKLGENLRDFVAGLQEAGESINAPDWLLDRTNTRPVQELPLYDVIQMHRLAKQLAYIGAGETEMRAHVAGTSFAQAVSEVVGEIQAHPEHYIAPGDKVPELRSSRTAINKLSVWHQKNVALRSKAEFIIRDLDGFKDMGPVYRQTYGPLRAGMDREVALKEKFIASVNAALELTPKAQRAGWSKKTAYPFLPQTKKAMTGEERIMVALNSGNEGNINAIRAGWGWTPEVHQQILNTLTREEWTTVQGIWKAINDLAPASSETYRIMTGVPMKLVEPVVVKTKFGDIAGSYFPLVWDPAASPQAAAFLEKKSQQDFFEPTYTSGRPEQGFTNERVGGKMAPLLNFNVITKHGTDSIRYATLAPAIRDVNKLFTNKEVSAAIVRRVGEEKYNVLRPWLQGIARPDRVPATPWDRRVGNLVSNSAVSALAFNPMAAMHHGMGVIAAAHKIGGYSLGVGAMKLLGSPLELSSWIEAQSPYMRNRKHNFDANLRAIAVGAPMIHGAWRTVVNDWGLAMIHATDNLTAKAVWLGAYEKHLDATHLGDTAGAVEYADMVVRQARGSGLPIDQPQIQRTGTMNKVFTMFYTPFASIYNMSAEAHAQLGEQKDFVSAKKLLSNYMWTILIPAVLMSLTHERESWKPADLVEAIPSYILGLYPVARTFKSVIPTAINAISKHTVPTGHDVNALPAISEPANDLIKAMKLISSKKYGEGVIEAISGAGPLIPGGAPTNQLATTLHGLKTAQQKPWTLAVREKKNR